MDTSKPDDERTSPVTFRFGDDEALCTKLIDLVRSGRKTATCGALREFGPGGDAMPEVGRRDTALNWNGTPTKTHKIGDSAIASKVRSMLFELSARLKNSQGWISASVVRATWP